jgi:hypothetical protein
VDKVIGSNPHGSDVGFTAEVLRQANLLAQRINPSSRDTKVDQEGPWNVFL